MHIKTTLRTSIFIAAVGALSLLTSVRFPASDAKAAQTDNQSVISVAGSAEVRAEPDIAVVTVGVSAVAPTADEAMADVSTRQTAVIAGARGLGIADRDIQTTGLSLQPIYRSQRSSDDAPPEIQAYRASNNVSLTVRTLSRASAVLDSAIANGANVIGGLRFGLSDPSALQRQALGEATTNAQAKAQAIAAAAGLTITGIVSIAEESVSTPRAQADIAPRALAAGQAAAAPPVEAGDLVITARVRATFSF